MRGVFSGLLDLYPNAAAAYSLRKLRNLYSGSAIEVRRSSDNTTQNIGFDINGNLDTTSLLSFVGVGNGFVRTLYDQSGNSQNFIQTTTSAQPQIVNNGSILLENGNPTILFNGAAHFMLVDASTAYFKSIHDGTSSTLIAVNRFGSVANPNTIYTLLDNSGGTSANVGMSLFYDDRAAFSRNNAFLNQIVNGVGLEASAIISNSNVILPNQQNIAFISIDANNATAADRIKATVNNGSEFGDNVLTNAPSSANAAFNLHLGVAVPSVARLLGSVQELVIYFTDQSANKTGLQNNINGFYGTF